MNQGKRTFLDNRHPEYTKHSGDWKFFHESYVGGEEYRQGGNLFKFRRESQEDYKDRLARTPRVNFTAQVIDLICSYLFKEPPTRKKENIGNELEAFWHDCDGKGTGIDDFMENIATEISIFGIYYIAVDKPALPNLTGTVREKEEKGLRPYVYGISPSDVLDVVFDSRTGFILQALIRERVRPAEINLSQERESDGLEERFRLWQTDGNQTAWSVWKRDKNGDPVKIEEGVIPLNRVPIVPVRRGKKTSMYSGKSMAGNFADLDRSIYNFDSCLGQIIYDQTFSILALEYDGLYDSFYEKWDKTVSTKSILPYPKGGTPPAFVSPDASQGQLIVEKIEKTTALIYKLTNLLSEVGNAEMKGNESGVAKAYDFEKLNAVLGNFADDLEEADEAVARLVLLFEGQSEEAIKDDVIDYPDKFDVKSLMQELSEYHQIALAGISTKFEAYLKKQLVRKIAPKIPPDLLEEIEAEIDNPPKTPEEGAYDELARIGGK